MKITLFICLFSSLSIAATAASQPDYLKLTKLMTRYASESASKKDIPSTCWFIGQARGLALAFKDSGNSSGQRLVDLIDKGAGRCKGENKKETIEASFDQAEWQRIGKWVQSVQEFKN